MKMSKHKQQEVPITDVNSLSDFIAENEIIKWVGDNGRTLLWLLLAFAALILFFYKVFGGGPAKLEKGYFLAQSNIDVLEKGSDQAAQEKALEQLTTFTNQYPSLQSKYDGLIAQFLLNRDQVKVALPFANRTLVRTGKDHLPFYADYAHTSLLISQEKYQDALKEALKLKEQMISQAKGKEREFGDTLYFFNLLRIAMLHQQLENKNEELNAWQELKQSAIENQAADYFLNADLFEKIGNQLKDGNASLLNYIQVREKLLKKN